MILAAAAAAIVMLAGADSLVVRTDLSKAPEAGEVAGKTQAIFEEWYPKINDILYGADHPLPFAEIRIVFDPESAIRKFAAYADDNVIHVSAAKLKHMRDDYRGMMIHELTHVNQHYPSQPKGSVWLSEGIADYIRHKYFEKDIELSLHVDARGRLTGYSDTAPYFYSLEQRGVDLRRDGYRLSYTVSSTFLYWLEQRKDRDIVRKVNLAFSQQRYSPKLFETWCGAPLDRLWQEFLAAGR